MHSLFEFTESSNYKASADSFVLQIPLGIQSKMELLAALSNTGKFPSYFGKNWDALFDCLRDFSWISQKQIVILHSDLPLSGNAQECQIYLETLQTSIKDWADRPTQSQLPSESRSIINHKLIVVFPIANQNDVLRISSIRV